MAEVFGLAAAGIGLAPIALELGKTVKKLRDYCRDVKSAPQDIEDFTEEVDALCEVLVQLDGLEIVDCPSSSPAFKRCYGLCTKANRTLSGIVSELQSGLNLTGNRTRLAFPLKKERMKQHADRVASAKSSLLLACNVYLMWQSKTQAVAQQRMVSEVLATLQAQRDSSSRHFEDLLSGNQTIVDSVRKTSSPETQKSWIWDACTYLATRGWIWQWRSYRIVRRGWHDPAFEAVGRGDLISLQRLICAGEATMYDRDSDGRSILKYAAFYRHIHIVRWLHEMGASSGISVKTSEWFLWYSLLPPFERDTTLSHLASMIEHATFIAKNFEFEIDDSDCESIIPVYFPELQSLVQLARPLESWNGHTLFQAVMHSLGSIAKCQIAISYGLLEMMRRPSLRGDIWDRHDEEGVCLIHSLAIAYMSHVKPKIGRIGRDKLRPILRRFLREAIEVGTDLHTVDDSHKTPFTGLIEAHARNYCWRKYSGDVTTINDAMQCWVEDLAREGVNIAEYGDIETQAWRSWTDRDSAGLTVYGFAYGSCAQDWSVYLEQPGDVYSGVFWDMIEHPERQLPGSWVSQDEWLWEDMYFDGLHRNREDRKWWARAAYADQAKRSHRGA